MVSIHKLLSLLGLFKNLIKIGLVEFESGLDQMLNIVVISYIYIYITHTYIGYYTGIRSVRLDIIYIRLDE